MRAKTFLLLALHTLLGCGGDEVAGPVPGDFIYASVSTGKTHACALTETGLAYCWGANEQGQLGDGTQTDQHVPVLVSGTVRFTVISAGESHTCALDGDGLAYCWGANWTGQLGDETTEGRFGPVPVAGGFTFKSIHAGRLHTCALTPSGKAYCWGTVLEGDLVYPPAPFPSNHDMTFRQLDSQYSLICGLTDDDRLYCWGGIAPTDYLLDWTVIPILIDEGLAGYEIAAGRGDVCGLSPTGEIECWLGDDAFPDVGLVGPYQAADGAIFEHITRGTRPTCGIQAGGLAHCWRVNIDWRFGKNQVPEPPAFSYLSEVPGVDFASLSSSFSGGISFSCGVALPAPEGSEVYCWGYNINGQLGDGTTERSDVPVRVLLP